jgi:hypothetical protein
VHAAQSNLGPRPGNASSAGSGAPVLHGAMEGRTDAGHCERLLPAPVLLAPTHTDRSLHAFPLVRSKAWEAEGRAGARGAGSRCSAARCGASGAACCWYGQTPGIGRTVQGRQSSKGFRKARPRARPGLPLPATARAAALLRLRLVSLARRAAMASKATTFVHLLPLSRGSDGKTPRRPTSSKAKEGHTRSTSDHEIRSRTVGAPSTACAGCHLCVRYGLWGLPNSGRLENPRVAL